jgi:hypothetical protein
VQNECGITLTVSQLATMFRIQAEQVRKIRCKAQSKGKIRIGRLHLTQIKKQSSISFGLNIPQAILSLVGTF